MCEQEIKVVGRAHKCRYPNPEDFKVGTVIECRCSKRWVVKNNIFWPAAGGYFGSWTTFDSRDYKSWEPYEESIVEPI